MASGDIPNFITQTTGERPEVSAAEQQLVTRKFTNLYDNLLLNHPDKVNEPGGMPGMFDRLHLEIPYVTGDRWTADVGTLTPPSNAAQLAPEDLPVQLIDIQRWDGENIREKYSYVLTADDVVRRYDSGDVYAGQFLQEALGEDLASLIEAGKHKTHEEIQAELRAAARYAIEKSQADENEGKNNQLVGLPEMDGLETMLTMPNVTAGYPPEKIEIKIIF